MFSMFNMSIPDDKCTVACRKAWMVGYHLRNQPVCIQIGPVVGCVSHLYRNVQFLATCVIRSDTKECLCNKHTSWYTCGSNNCPLFSVTKYYVVL